jgi:hypothetical protein
MLTITDLSRNEELSAARMGNVAGGVSCDNAQTLADGYLAIAGVLGVLGDPVNSAVYSGKASGVLEGACGVHPQ